jgi:molybdopterin-guanine dinucleotide biosynthesis protein A
MATGNRDSTPNARDDVSITWHRSDDDDEVILAAAANGVRVAVAFPADAARPDVEAVLAERDRELRHFFDAQTGRSGSS